MSESEYDSEYSDRNHNNDVVGNSKVVMIVDMVNTIMMKTVMMKVLLMLVLILAPLDLRKRM